MKKNKMIAIILVLNLIITTMLSLFPSRSFAAVQKIDTNINNIDNKKYPGIKSMIQNLQKQHPNWKFKLFYTGLDWNEVITQEAKHGRNLIGKNLKNYTGDWVCSTCGTKGYSGANWLCASSSAIAYMMDPRNSIYYEDIFQFLELSYDSKATYDSNIIKKILTGTFLDDGNLDKYVKTILNRSKEKNVNPYYIAGKIIQEQGTKGGSTWKMKDGDTYYYNIFNVNAGGTTTSAIISNALSWAKDKGWNTIEKCLEGGIDFIANGYITIGQDTMYFEKFDVIADKYYTHQYAQDVLYAQNQGEKLRKILEGIKATEYSYTFVIPLYENMPSNACSRPSTTVTNQTDNLSGANNSTGSNIIIGDVTDDSTIDSADLLYLRKYLLGKITLSDKQKKSADTNKDGTIDSADLLNVRKYLLGKIKNF